MFRIAGELYQTKTPMEVSPESIAGAFDFVPVDGTMPVDRYAQAMLWKEIMMGIEKAPQLQGRVDVLAVLKHIAFLSGVKNFSQFEIKVQPDALMQQQAQAGNVVPLGGQGGSGPGRQSPVAGGPTRDLTQIPQSGGIPGVGRAA